MSMDMTDSIIPRSDQINADDLIAGPITYTVREVVAGAAEPPFDFLLVETSRAYRPSKTMRRVIVNAWGSEAANYAGRRLTLYREPTIKFGGQEVGGIRISHMSHIDGPVEVMAQTTRGKREKFTVQPLSDPLPIPDQQLAAGEIPYEPVTLPAVGTQLTELSKHERDELYAFCGIEGIVKVAEATAILTSKAKELGLPDSDPPHARGVLDAFRMKRAAGGSAEAMDVFLNTGQDINPGDQVALT